MSMFHSASNTDIGGGIFSLVNGTQNNYYSQSSSERRLIRIQPGEEWKEILYQEYEPIPLGRIKLQRTLHHKEYDPPVNTWQERHTQAFQQDRRLEAERVVEIVSIADPNGRSESNPLLAVRYAGLDALELFKKDCVLFSHQRMTTIAQLQAFNDSRSIPIIIFNEGGPLQGLRMIDANNYNSDTLSRAHLGPRLPKTQPMFRSGEALFPGATSDELRVWGLLVTSFEHLLDLLWFRPQTGALCFGPPGPTLFSGAFPNVHLSQPYMDYPTGRSFCLELPPLPLNACHDDTVLFDYIMRNVPERSVVLETSSIYARSGYGSVHRGTRLWRERLMADRWAAWGEPLPLMRVLETPFFEWIHYPRYCVRGSIPSLRGRRKVMENGGMRFIFTRRLCSVGFRFTEGPTGEDRASPREELWLTQAGWAFSHLGISRRDWASCSFATCIELRLTSAGSYELEDPEDPYKDIIINPPCYLFVQPPPQLPDGAPDIETWLRGENLYYYSHDPEGGSALTEEERTSLGLPSFISEFGVEYAYWDTEAYDFMEKWQRAKGFDYSTIDYAKSLGFPILEVTIPQAQGHSEDLMNSPDGFEMDVDCGMNAQIEFTPKGGTVDDVSSSDMDVDVDT
ncbi:hypothetical protein PM082_016798 [Marasmius tenuissimus]|nr:hypothetical protein PM082_016798 [Marasmius tenuissimus]